MTQDVRYDVVIVGSGVAGALIGAKLAAAGVKVRILEAGPRTDRTAAVRHPVSKRPVRLRESGVGAATHHV